jgi:ubiquinone/menaquinone biosynthesis C-methylase UbiE
MAIRIPLGPGEAVPDLCCGVGASAIPARRAVGARGWDLGGDVAAPLLARARVRASSKGLRNNVCVEGDSTQTGPPSGAVDAIACAFGVSFAPDVPAFVAGTCWLVRAGETLAITTQGPGWGEPANGLFWDGVREIEPRLFSAFNLRDEVTTPQALADRGGPAGIKHASVEATRRRTEVVFTTVTRVGGRDA